MSPNVEDGEEVERLRREYQPVESHGCRVQPEGFRPARAWVECESASRANSPGENERLLDPVPTKSRLQSGVMLGVWTPQKWSKETALDHKTGPPPAKTKFQKRKEKLLAILKPPYFVLSMVIVMVSLFVCGGEAARALLEWSPDAWPREPWRLLTYGMVHAGPTHLAVNALMALALGWRLEREQGWWRLAAVWTGGVAAGALGAGVLQTGVRVVGASAAVYALLTAHLPNVCLRFGYIPLWWFRPLSVVVLAACDAGWTAAHASPSHDHVAWAAHVFGAAAGLLLAFIIFTGENASRRYIAVCRVMSAVSLAAAAALVALHCAGYGGLGAV